MEEKSKKITIKINGKDSSTNSLKEDFLQEIVDESTATNEKESEDEFDWMIPEIQKSSQEPVIYSIKGKKNKSQKKKHIRGRNGFPKNKNSKFSRVLVIALFAVMVGTGLGLGILKIVSSSLLSEGEKEQQQTVQQTQSEPVNGKSLSIELPSLSYYVVQAGVFTQQEALKKESTSLSNLNIPNVQISSGEQEYIYIGVAPTLEDAKKLGSTYEKEGVSYYAKELKIGGKERKNLNETEKELLEQMPVLYEGILEASTKGYLYGTIDEKTIQKVNSAVEKWRKLRDQQIKDKQLKQLKEETDTSISYLQEYNESRDSKKILNLQQSLLNILSLYHKM